MPLSEHEQRVIDELERSLLRDDPGLANAFRTTAPRSPRHILMVALGVVIGMGVLVLGAAMESVLIGVGGFVVMFATLTWAVTKKPTRRVAGDIGEFLHTNKNFETSNFSEPESGESGFMGRMEDRWNKRQGEPR